MLTSSSLSVSVATSLLSELLLRRPRRRGAAAFLLGLGAPRCMRRAASAAFAAPFHPRGGPGPMSSKLLASDAERIDGDGVGPNHPLLPGDDARGEAGGRLRDGDGERAGARGDA